MKVKVSYAINLKIDEVLKKTDDAVRQGLRDTIVAIHNDAVKNAKFVGFWDTGHNASSIASEVSGMGGEVFKGKDAEPERMVNDSKLEAACYSTSGYGGYGETGTYRTPAKPYFKPALDAHSKELPDNIKRYYQ